jgi:hypothetical protein
MEKLPRKWGGEAAESFSHINLLIIFALVCFTIIQRSLDIAVIDHIHSLLFTATKSSQHSRSYLAFTGVYGLALPATGWFSFTCKWLLIF